MRREMTRVMTRESEKLQSGESSKVDSLVSRDRRLALSSSEWTRSFDCSDMRPLIICRGPIRKEAMDVFTEMGLSHFGILLSEKDSVTYSQALAPELRSLTDPRRIHRVNDYSGPTKEERQARIEEMIQIARDHGYNSIFAGYGFMSEDPDMVSSMERAGLCFIGPGSHVQSAAGLKDEAKRTAAKVGVTVTPGVDNATLRAILKKAPTLDALYALAAKYQLELPQQCEALDELAVHLLDLGHSAGIDLYTVEEVTDALREGVREMFISRPHARVRLKAISGGGGKGQRILNAPSSYTDIEHEEGRLEAALAPLASLAREVLAEVKCLGVGDNKNVVAEINVEETSHQEIQVIGNGEWCLTIGGRDCSLQMHEQKLLEVSVIEEDLEQRLSQISVDSPQSAKLKGALKTLRRMEEEATRFGEAVGLDSVSTFECIVSGDEHYFMEMNTRIQVEHRVSELCYTLRFSNPSAPEEFFEVDSLVELMVLIARHKRSLPKPTRFLRQLSSVEARINATNDALKPHAGGVIHDWSAPLEGEVRDDQGISSPNPDTQAFMRYHLAGAYDSNIALLLTVGGSRRESYERMAEVFRRTKLIGDQLCTNLHFHYGLIQWFLSRDVYASVNTKFVAQYLAAVGALKAEASQLLLIHLWSDFKRRFKKSLEAQGGDGLVAAQLFDERLTLVTRPVQRLLDSPHLLAGWLSIQRAYLIDREGQFMWIENPLKVLAHLYHFLNLEWREGRPALQQIWSHDASMLECGLQFYQDVSTLLKHEGDWQELKARLAGESPTGVSDELWRECQASHLGHQCGLELLAALTMLGERSEYHLLDMGNDGEIIVPPRFMNSEVQAQLWQHLAPPPPARAGELVAVSGGMFYPREAPDQPKLIEVGDHFEEGQALYIIEVMKMFNKAYAPFSGTITDVLIEGEGVIIKKGQPLFKVKPDQELIELDPAERAASLARYSLELAQELDSRLAR